jgi:hypothetical protein
VLLPQDASSPSSACPSAADDTIGTAIVTTTNAAIGIPRGRTERILEAPSQVRRTAWLEKLRMHVACRICKIRIEFAKFALYN